jgi:hypothetical protein
VAEASWTERRKRFAAGGVSSRMSGTRIVVGGTNDSGDRRSVESRSEIIDGGRGQLLAFIAWKVGCYSL